MRYIGLKIIRGNPYYYLRECQRVAGKSKIVSTIYLGPRKTSWIA